MDAEQPKLPSQVVTPKKRKPRRHQNPSSSCFSSCSSNEASINSLPPEIITNILSRLHFKSVGLCKCVSKPWRSILSDSTTFPVATIQLSQLSNFTPDLLLRFKSETSRGPSSRVYYIQDTLALSKTILRPFKFLDESQSFPYDAVVVGSCNGFVCYLTSIKDITSAVTEAPFIYVFNPLTEERLMLPPLPIPKHHKPYIRDWKYGFGFDDSVNQFKVVFAVKIFSYRSEWSTFKLGYKQLLVHTVGTTCWTSKIDTVPDILFGAEDVASSAFVSRSLHWVTYTTPFNPLKGNLCTDHFLYIASFNLVTHEFESVPTPESHVFKNFPRKYRLCVLDGRLSFLEHYVLTRDHFINVWVMNKYNVRDSWVKLFTIQGIGSPLPEPIKLLKTGELLLLNRNRDMIVYHPIKQKTRHFKLGWRGKNSENTLEVHPIVGTRLSIKAAFAVDSDTQKTAP